MARRRAASVLLVFVLLSCGVDARSAAAASATALPNLSMASRVVQIRRPNRHDSRRMPRQPFVAHRQTAVACGRPGNNFAASLSRM